MKKNLESQNGNKRIRWWKIQASQLFTQLQSVYGNPMYVPRHVFQWDVFLFSNNISMTINLSTTISISVRIYKLTYRRWAWKRRVSQPNYTGKRTWSTRNNLSVKNQNISKWLREQHLKKISKYTWHRVIDTIIRKLPLYFEC